jgi:hypothetical protein
VKAIVKLIVIALLANALWRVGSVYASYYKFKDAVTDAAMEEGISEDDLRQKIADLATTYDLPLKSDAITVRQDVHHTSIQGSFTKPIAVVPGFDYAWPFDMNVDAYIVAAPTPRGNLLK